MSKTAVVILNWNGRRHLERFLCSVVEYTPAGVDVVVADNGSDDGSVEYLRAGFPTVKTVLLDSNYGFAEGYNRALEQVEADVFVLLNSDVEVTERWLEPLVAILDNNPEVAAVQPKIRSYVDRTKFEYAGASGGFIDALGYPFCRGRILSHIETDNGQYDTARNIFWATGACMAVRAGVFRRLGGFDGAFFAHMEEIDFCWRAQLAGYSVMVEPRSVVYHLGGGTLDAANPRKTYLNFRNNLSMMYKNLPKGRLLPVMFVRMVLDGIAAACYLVTGRVKFFKAVWNAHVDFYRRLKELRSMRRAIQSSAAPHPQGIYRGSIILRYIFGRKSFGRMM